MPPTPFIIKGIDPSLQVLAQRARRDRERSQGLINVLPLSPKYFPSLTPSKRVIGQRHSFNKENIAPDEVSTGMGATSSINLVQRSYSVEGTPQMLKHSRVISTLQPSCSRDSLPKTPIQKCSQLGVVSPITMESTHSHLLSHSISLQNMCVEFVAVDLVRHDVANNMPSEIQVECPILASGVPYSFPPNISGECGLMDSTGCGFIQHEQPLMCSSLAPSSIGTTEMAPSTSIILNTSIPLDQKMPSVMQVDLLLTVEGLHSALPLSNCGDQCVLQSGCSAVVHPSIPSSVPNTFVTPNISLFASTSNAPSTSMLSEVEM